MERKWFPFARNLGVTSAVGARGALKKEREQTLSLKGAVWTYHHDIWFGIVFFWSICY